LPWGSLALDTAALLVYPGLLACLVFGLAAEFAAARLLGARLAVPSGLWQALRTGTVAPLAAGAALLALLAASQLALPFSPLAAPERNMLVAAAALVVASWLAWSPGWDQPRLDARLVLAAQACWLVALLAPALVSQTLRPQVLGAVVLLTQLPLKLIAAGLYLLCLPVLLQLLPETAPAGTPGSSEQETDRLRHASFAGVRVLLWLPLCGLFASVFVPPAADDALAVAGSAAATVAAAAAAILVAAALTRWRVLSARHLYFRMGLPVAFVALLLAALAEVYAQGL
jgi:hypothetical protein